VHTIKGWEVVSFPDQSGNETTKKSSDGYGNG